MYEVKLEGVGLLRQRERGEKRLEKDELSIIILKILAPLV